MSYNYRNIGLGMYGYATALMKLGLRYGSSEALKFTDQIFGLMFRAAVIKSNELAAEKGAFPKYEDCVLDSTIIKNHFSADEIDRFREAGLRNCSLISIAPNGSLSTLQNESGGCEPEFAISYNRRTVGMTDGEDTYYQIFCKGAKEYIKLYQTEKLPDYFVSSADIPWQDRVKTQAIMQEHVDTAISSTVNLPQTATKEDIAGLYLMAWKEGCKGITIFRDGCKRLGILTTDNSKPKEENNVQQSCGLARGEIIEVSDDVIGLKRKLTTGCGSLHCTAFFDPYTGELLETYLSKGSTGGCQNYMIGLSRMISLAARGGVGIDDIIDQLNSCGTCPSYATRTATKHDTSKGSCCPIAVGHALKEMYEEMQQNISPTKSASIQKQVNSKTMNNNGEKCPQCGEQLIREIGCNTCKFCGYSKCD